MRGLLSVKLVDEGLAPCVKQFDEWLAAQCVKHSAG